MLMALPEFLFHKWMGKTYVFLSHWLWLYILLISKKRQRVLKCTESQTRTVVLLTPLARSFALQRRCFCETARVFQLENQPPLENSLMGVLNASDENRSHAVTVHDGSIYDANKLIAIPLCQEALDYCTSTQQRRGHLLTSAELRFFITGVAKGSC
jgi:hypothetical protein